jgi:hypothetical protein
MEGPAMSHLRFSPGEYQAIQETCRTLNLDRCRPRALKRLLTGALASLFPELAERIRMLKQEEMQLLHKHLRGQNPSRQRDELTDDEFSLFESACGPLLDRSRFLHALKATLVQHFLQHHPALAAKLVRAGQSRFQALCDRIKARREGSSPEG